MSARHSTAGGLEPDGRAAGARRALRWGTFAAVLVWFVAFAGGPLLHQLGHTDDHVHLPTGAIVRVDGSRAPDPRATDDRAPGSRDGDPAPDRAPLDHGAGSLAHLGASAVLSAAAGLSVDAADLAYAASIPDPPATTAPVPRWARPRAPRGPPSSIA